MRFLKRSIWKILSKYQDLTLGGVGEGSKIHPSVKISGHSKNISVGQGVLCCPHATIDCDSESAFIHIGDHTIINSYCMLLCYGGSIKIGERCNINPFAILYGHGGLEIGNNVLIAAHTVIIPANHSFLNRNALIADQGLTMQGILIEDDVWIGAGVTILDGVRIGRGSVIGAGSVVTKNVEPYSVVAGVPGTVLKKR